MTQRLKEAINALQALDILTEQEQQRIAADILKLVDSAKTSHEKSSHWGPLWRKLSAHERAEEFRAWIVTKSGGPGLTLEQTHRDTIYE